MIELSDGISMDPEIVEFVELLNRGGFRTIGSCAGHAYFTPRGETPFWGYVEFASVLSRNRKAQVVALAKSHGLAGLRWDDSDPGGGRIISTLEFDSVLNR